MSQVVAAGGGGHRRVMGTSCGGVGHSAGKQTIRERITPSISVYSFPRYVILGTVSGSLLSVPLSIGLKAKTCVAKKKALEGECIVGSLGAWLSIAPSQLVRVQDLVPGSQDLAGQPKSTLLSCSGFGAHRHPTC